MQPAIDCAPTRGDARDTQTLGVPSAPDPDAAAQPQFRNRRAFVVWAVQHGFAPPQRLTECILAEIEEGEQCRSG
jgi:hypothetical protein